MAEWLDTISTHWFWLSLGLFLLLAEWVARDRFLIWVGLAALIVGAADYFLPITLAYQVAMFLILSVLTVFAGKKFQQ
jgi:membrane protein implicated in regulation of membrane protease activity